MERRVTCRCQADLEIEAGQGAAVECDSCHESVEGLDIFICHAVEDQPMAERIGRGLTEKGIRWIGSFVGREDRWQDRPSIAIPRSRVALLLCSQHSNPSGSVLEELRLAADRWRLPRELVRLDKTVPSGNYAYLSGTFSELDAQANSFMPRLITVLQDRLAERTEVTADHREVERPRGAENQTLDSEPATGGVDPTDSPYIGPSSFTAEATELFFGRDSEAAELSDCIQRYQTVLLYSPSGAGKSSLIDTKVRQLLEKAKFDVLPLARVGTVLPIPVDSVPETSTNIYTFATISSLHPEADETTCREFLDRSLNKYLQSRPLAVGRKRVLILDQFEEIITKSYSRPDDQRGFFQQLRIALKKAGDSLRIVLVFRQEYLAEIEVFCRALEGGKKYRLARLGQEGARQAVTGPASAKGVRFEADVVQGLVHELSLIKARGRGGDVRIHKGEYVEPVHLQIACDRLWQNLEPELDVITAADIARAARRNQEPGRMVQEATLADDLSKFVGDVLNDFYENAVREAAATGKPPSGRAATELTPEEELIHLACMQFVTAKGTRKMVHREEQRTGRLTNEVVAKLEDRHLLRGELRGAEKWYELAHDTLTQPIIAKRQNSVELIKLLNALDSLAALVKQAKADTDDRLSGFFEAYEGVLNAVDTFLSRPGLYEDEAEFICRCSLTSGYMLNNWARRLHDDYPDILRRVVSEAIQADNATVRRNAAELLSGNFLEARGAEGALEAKETIDPETSAGAPLSKPAKGSHLRSLEHHLYELAIDDDEPEVRAQASLSLARLDREDLYDRLREKLDAPGKNPRAIDVLAHAKDQTLRHPGEGHFEQRWQKFPGSVRRKILYKVAALRLHAGVLRLIVVALLCAVTTPPFVAISRTPLGHWGLTQTQTNVGAIRGLFHGMVGGVCWGAGISLAITLYWVVFQRGEPDSRRFRWQGPAVFGAIGGLLGGGLLALIVVGVFEVPSLVGNGWIQQERSSILHSLLVETRFGFQFPVSGTFLGCGIGWMAVAMFYGRRWRDFLAEQVELGPVTEGARAGKAFSHIVVTSIRSSWRVFLCLLISGFVLHRYILRPGAGITPAFASDTFQMWRQAGDALSLYTGSLGLMSGLGFAFLILRVGIGAELRGTKGGEGR